MFFKIGLFAIGGGLATLPLLKEALLDSAWMSHGEFIDMVAVSQATPGPIGINMATYAGFKMAGVTGGLIATAGIVAPSLIIIILIARFMQDYADNIIVKDALAGLRPAAAGMITAAGLYIFGNSVIMFDLFPSGGWFSIRTAALFAILGTFYMAKKGNPVFYLLAGAAAGIIFL
jgi:chromate transporter